MAKPAAGAFDGDYRRARPDAAELGQAAFAFWSFCWRSPFFVNNVFIGAFFEALILGSAIKYLIQHGHLPKSLKDIEAEVFPTIRVGVIAIFFFAVLHKTNKAFLDPEISCAGIHYRQLQYVMKFLPSPDAPGMGKVVVWLTWATEISIPILLSLGWARIPSRRVVTLAILVALGFHFVMSFNGYQNFSAMALAYYVPYLPHNFHRTLSALIKKTSRTTYGKAFVIGMKIVGAMLLAFSLELLAYAIFKNLFPLSKARGQTFARRQGWLLFNVGAPLVSILFAYLSVKRYGRANILPGKWPPAWTYVLLAIVSFGSMCPYLGLKTENSFAMFSNLLTEGDASHWNHVFLPRSMRIFHFQDHLVNVKKVVIQDADANQEKETSDNAIGSNLPGLRNLRSFSDRRMVEFEFRRNVGIACRRYPEPISIDYEIDGKDYHVDDAHKVPELANGNGYWLEKLMFFRPVPNSPYGVCLH